MGQNVKVKTLHCCNQFWKEHTSCGEAAKNVSQKDHWRTGKRDTRQTPKRAKNGLKIERSIDAHDSTDSEDQEAQSEEDTGCVCGDCVSLDDDTSPDKVFDKEEMLTLWAKISTATTIWMVSSIGSKISELSSRDPWNAEISDRIKNWCCKDCYTLSMWLEYGFLVQKYWARKVCTPLPR